MNTSDDGLPPPQSQYLAALKEISAAFADIFGGTIDNIPNNHIHGVSPKDQKFLNALREFRQAIITSTGGGSGGGGTVDSVSVNGGTPAQPDQNKNVNLTVSSETVNAYTKEQTNQIKNALEIDIQNETAERESAVASEESARVSGDAAALQSAKDYTDDELEPVKDLIPAQAATTNKLADKEFVNSSIQNMAAFPAFYNATRGWFPTAASVASATQVYNVAGNVITGSLKNDYFFVVADEDAPAPYTGGTTRWAFAGDTIDTAYRQVGVNETPFTQAQLDALNSGITAGLVSDFIGEPATREAGDAATLTAANEYTDTNTLRKIAFPNGVTYTKAQIEALNYSVDKGGTDSIITMDAATCTDQSFAFRHLHCANTSTYNRTIQFGFNIAAFAVTSCENLRIMATAACDVTGACSILSSSVKLQGPLNFLGSLYLYTGALLELRTGAMTFESIVLNQGSTLIIPTVFSGTITRIVKNGGRIYDLRGNGEDNLSTDGIVNQAKFNGSNLPAARILDLGPVQSYIDLKSGTGALADGTPIHLATYRAYGAPPAGAGVGTKWTLYTGDYDPDYGYDGLDFMVKPSTPLTNDPIQVGALAIGRDNTNTFNMLSVITAVTPVGNQFKLDLEVIMADGKASIMRLSTGSFNATVFGSVNVDPVNMVALNGNVIKGAFVFDSAGRMAYWTGSMNGQGLYQMQTLTT